MTGLTDDTCWWCGVFWADYAQTECPDHAGSRPLTAARKHQLLAATQGAPA